MESDPALSVYSEAKSEYMFQLSSYLAPAYFAFYIDLYERAKQETAAEPKKQLWQLQNFLAEIEDWNMERVVREVGGIQTRAACDYLEDLLTAVFVAHTKVLTAIRLNNKQKKVQLTVPKIDHFLLKVFIETSRLLWQNVYLFRENVAGSEKQQNYRQIQSLIDQGLKTAIRAMVPVKNLLKDCLVGAAEEDSDSEEELVAKPKPQPQVDELAPPVEEAAPAVEELAPVEEHPVLPSEAAPVEELAPMEEPVKNDIINPSPPLIIVDSEPQVSFSDYETIFDTEDSEGNLIQPSQFHEARDYEEPGLEILDDVGVPLSADDCDTLQDDSANLGPIEAEELPVM
jgi:Family of unknown function (DUF5764)